MTSIATRRSQRSWPYPSPTAGAVESGDLRCAGGRTQQLMRLGIAPSPRLTRTSRTLNTTTYAYPERPVPVPPTLFQRVVHALLLLLVVGAIVALALRAHA